MSEAPETTPAPAPKRHTLLFVSVAIVLLLVLVYVGGNFVLPAWLMASYQGKNCALALSLNSTYTSLYPAAMIDKNIAAPVQECALYSLAVETESQSSKTWQDTYDAYRAYLHNYPGGLFVGEAQEHSALALTGLAKDQLAARKYTEAIASINLVLKSFGRTPAAGEAGSMMSDVYTAWATDQHETSDFAGAETALKTFETWAQDAKRTDDVKSAQHALALTYLAWGQSLQTQQQFEAARAKLDLAGTTDPEPSAATGPAAQAKAATVELYANWGDSFLEKNDFVNALDRYQAFISLSESNDQPAAKARISAAYIKWAASLRDSQDFLGALKTIDQAKGFAVSDSAKKDIETTRADTLLAFSQSTGTQAQQAIADATEKICLHEQPALPIFGTDPTAIRAYLQLPADQDNLTDAIKATSPASLHYAACLVQSTKREVRQHSMHIKGQKSVVISGSTFTVERVVNEWDVQLYDLKTGRVVASQHFEGITPSWDAIWESIPNSSQVIDARTFAGAAPSLEIVSAWVEKFLK